MSENIMRKTSRSPLLRGIILALGIFTVLMVVWIALFMILEITEMEVLFSSTAILAGVSILIGMLFANNRRRLPEDKTERYLNHIENLMRASRDPYLKLVSTLDLLYSRKELTATQIGKILQLLSEREDNIGADARRYVQTHESFENRAYN